MGGSCHKCGYNKNYAALHFHHQNPNEKEFDWKKLRIKKWDSVIEELKKCLMLCSNCHMELHNPQLESSIQDKNNLSDNNRLNYFKTLEKTSDCPQCGKDVFSTRFCSVNCSSLYQRKVIRPSKEELLDLMKNNSWVGIAKKYEVSDNAVRKWARSYGLLEK